MKIEGSIQEIKEFIKEFQSKDTVFSKQQLTQIKEIISDVKIDGDLNKNTPSKNDLVKQLIRLEGKEL